MGLQKLTSFTQGGQGGNPAGVMLCAAALPTVAEMQRIAADLGYSETAFAAPEGTRWRVRYFAPEGEVPFCGHATIALGAALGAAKGAGVYALALNAAEIQVEAYSENGVWGAKLTSPGTAWDVVPPDLLAEVTALFGLSQGDLDPALPPALANAGAQHLVLPLARGDLLRAMAYEFDAGAALMQAHGLVTINLIWREKPGLVHARNAFAGHGVYEDPATGAAAAALAGYLRDGGHGDAPFDVVQGVDMGAPSRLHVRALPGTGAPVEVAGLVRDIA